MGIDNMPLTILVCLLLTLIIESLVAFLIGVRKGKDFLNIILVNIVTNPIVVTVPYLIYIYFGFKFYNISIYVLEILTLIVEGLIYLKVLDYNKINPILLSAILNLCSYGIGLILNGIWWFMKKFTYVLLSLLILPSVVKADVAPEITDYSSSDNYLPIVLTMSAIIVIVVIATIIKNKKGK